MGSLVEEVEEARARSELLLQHEHALVLEHPADLAVRVEEVAEDARPRVARLEAGGETPFPGPMQAERALLHDARGANAVREVGLDGVDVLGGELWLVPVEAPRVVGASCLAVATADAPVVVHDDDAVGLLPRGLHGAHVHARRIVTLLTLHRQVVLTWRGHLVVVGRVALLQVEGALIHLEHPDVRVVRRSIVVVLLVAGLGAAAAPDAHAQVQRVTELHVLHRADVADVDVAPVLGGRLLLQAPQHPLHLLLVEFAVVTLEELVEAEVPRPLPERRHGLREGAGPQRGAHHLQGDTSIDLSHGGPPGRAWARTGSDRAAGAPGAPPDTRAREGRGNRRNDCGAAPPARGPSTRACRRGIHAGSRGSGGRGTARRAGAPRSRATPLH